MNKRNEPQMEHLRVANLKELDALVGKHLTNEQPQIFWEEQQVSLRFDSIQEALEAMRDPYFQQFIPEDARSKSSLAEVQEFRAYSSDLSCAWEIVELLSSASELFQVSRNGSQWSAAFGDREFSGAHSAPVAICIAGLRVRGISVEMANEWAPAAAPAQTARVERQVA